LRPNAFSHFARAIASRQNNSWLELATDLPKWIGTS
jgi:hypothetical protein